MSEPESTDASQDQTVSMNKVVSFHYPHAELSETGERAPGAKNHMVGNHSITCTDFIT